MFIFGKIANAYPKLKKNSPVRVYIYKQNSDKNHNNEIKNSITDKYFNTHKVNENERSYDKLIEIVEEEIDKFKSLKKNRKDKSFYFNSKVSSIRKLADDFETIDFHDELFKLIKYEDSA